MTPFEPAFILPPALDYAGVAVFALTGALAAARDKHDIITFWFFAVVTGVGGGTLRDLLIGAPVFWLGDPTYLALGLAAALIVWFLAPHLERAKTLIWIDAVGLAVYAVIGAGKAISLGVDPFVSIAMGVLTACFGGVIRDVARGSAIGVAEARNHHLRCAAFRWRLCGAERGGRRSLVGRCRGRAGGFWFARRGHTLWLGVAGVRRETWPRKSLNSLK